MTRAAFRQVDLTRAIKGAKAGGFDPARAEILPDGRIPAAHIAVLCAFRKEVSRRSPRPSA